MWHGGACGVASVWRSGMWQYGMCVTASDGMWHVLHVACGIGMWLNHET
jgi:hypothetical protein